MCRYVVKSLLSVPEKIMYDFLQKVAEYNDLVLHCQVSFSAFVQVESETDNKEQDKEFWNYYNKICRKYVDYCFISKKSLEICAIVELNDKTHTEQYDLERREFFKSINLPYFAFESLKSLQNKELKYKFYQFIRESKNEQLLLQK